jgi:predicted polyphosphate/ATP-dependent NAD kinase
VSAVGIIPNPASGKDIRRLVAQGSVFDNQEKANIVARLLLGLEAVGVERAWIMPDSFGIGLRALERIHLNRLHASLLDLAITHTSVDTERAAMLLIDMGVGCIVTLGGDGTNRLVARASSQVPLMAVSTGTNNVFPTMVEGTLAGLAAGLVARGLADAAVRRVPYLEVNRPDSAVDIALVDAAAYDEQFVGARAMWDSTRILELVLARVEPGTIGLSSIAAHLGLETPAGSGVYMRMGDGGQRVLAPIAPGLLASVPVADYQVLRAGDAVRFCQPRPCTLALDGEREVTLPGGSEVCIRLNADGPRVVDVRHAIGLAARSGIFVV